MESILDTAQETKDLWLDRSWALGENLVLYITKAEVFNLWVLSPLGVEQPFHGGHLKLLENRYLH